jgi:hypothetical protein
MTTTTDTPLHEHFLTSVPLGHLFAPSLNNGPWRLVTLWDGMTPETPTGRLILASYQSRPSLYWARSSFVTPLDTRLWLLPAYAAKHFASREPAMVPNPPGGLPDLVFETEAEGENAWTQVLLASAGHQDADAAAARLGNDADVYASLTAAIRSVFSGGVVEGDIDTAFESLIIALE